MNQFEGLYELTHQILHLSSEPLTRTEFLQELSGLILNFFECDLVEFNLIRVEDPQVWRLAQRTKTSQNFRYVVFPASDADYSDELYSLSVEFESFREYCSKIADGNSRDHSLQGAFLTNDLHESASNTPPCHSFLKIICNRYMDSFSSLVIIPLIAGERCIGYLKLLSKKKNFFSKASIDQFNGLSQNLGLTLLNNRAQAALRERVKELSCLYEIAKNSVKPDISLDQLMLSIANRLPPAWQYPGISKGRVIMDGRSFTSQGFIEGVDTQTADIIVNQEFRGRIEVTYTEKKPRLFEGPFLEEERKLIDEIASQVALIIERWESVREKQQLKEQLRHADRLATIGQLTAGIAHELNEYLGSMLGFAQLANKTPDIPETVGRDLDKIVRSSLYARDIVKKLLIFARQVPTLRFRFNLNALIDETISFFEARCVNESIEIVKSVDKDIPDIHADPGQLNQVIVNLVVNAMQAMPDGGRLLLSTAFLNDSVVLSVQDSGIGMIDETIKQIFVPFFTTKDINQGTGLGLAVVNSIIADHGGKINVSSIFGRGSRFDVHLPVKEYSDEGS